MEKNTPFMKTALKAAKEAGKVLIKYHGNILEEKTKEGNWHEVVTNADLESNKILLRHIQGKFPDHDIVSEEEKIPQKGSDYLWYLDPLDGTTNYTLNLMFSSVCLGLARKGELVLGVVCNPFTDELFSAEKGKGARLNGKPVYVSDNSDLKATVVNYCHPNIPEEIDKVASVFSELKKKSRDMRRLGSAGLDLSYIACGRNDVDFHTNAKMSPWDFAAGIVIAREAGAKLTDFDNKPFRLGKSKSMLVTNGKLHEQMLGILKKIK